MIPYEFDAERFSRWMAYVLRHNPERYGLTPDRHGYVDLDELLRIAQRRYRDVPPERLREFLELSGTKRFEVAGNRVRARYGHSIPVEPAGPTVEPPAQLYHGTEPARVQAILAEGLKPMGRQLLHLSETIADALAVASRKTQEPAVVRVAALEAHRSGLAFYHEGSVYLTSHIPAQFLALEPLPSITSAEPPNP